MARLELTDITKSFDGKTAVLKGIHLTAEQGDFVVLVGPSGCGKSTLLRLIAGLEEPDQGDIRMDGQSVVQRSPSDRNIAMVFQDYALYPHMTVRGNMAFGLKIQGLPGSEIESRVREASLLLDIESLLDRKPAQLSGGQRQRVAIGRAIVRKPSIFLFDEPLSNLDAKLRAQMRIEIAALHKRLGNTVVYVTHDQEEAMTLADKIVVLHQGVVQQLGSPVDLYSSPGNQFVATFIGNPAMNLLSGALEYQAGQMHWVGRGWGCYLPHLPVNMRHQECEQLGVRPEDIRLSPDSPVRARLLLKEMHGHETQIVVELGQDRLILRVRDREEMQQMQQMQAGDSLGIQFETERLHWFDKKGLRLS